MRIQRSLGLLVLIGFSLCEPLAGSTGGWPEQPQWTACFVTGHGERDIESSVRKGYNWLKQELEINKFQVKTQVILERTEIPADCSLLIVAGPGTDSLPQEVETIRKYLNGGGRALFMLDPGIDLSNLSILLRDWNVIVQSDLVVELDTNARFMDKGLLPLIFNYGRSPIVQPLVKSGTFFPFTRSFLIGTEFKAGLDAEPLCLTSPQSYGYTDFDAKAPPKQVSFRADKDFKGPLTVAVSATFTGVGEKKAEGRIVALGTSLLGDNGHVGLQSNRFLIVNMIDWLLGLQVLNGPSMVAGEVAPPKVKLDLPVAESEPDASQAQAAVGALRSINTAEVRYSSTFTQGFSRTLAALGGPAENPTAEAAGLIEESLAGGRKDGYVFTYKPAAVDHAGHTTAYTFVARPIKWRPSLLSFFTNESGAIRWTTEDREPTEKDQPLPIHNKEPLPVPQGEPDASQAQSAVGSLRWVNTAEITYSSTFTRGFTRTLAALGGAKEGPTPEAAGLIDDSLASGRQDGYIFTYNPGAVDQAGHTTTYTFVARPIKWRQGLLSFFTNQSAVIRWTTEDREPTEKDPPIGSDTSNRIRRGEIERAKVIFSPQPAYPPNARAARVQGTVRLKALIGEDGGIEDLKLIEGHPLLVKAAMDAVKQWRYQPTLVDGKPVKVLTEIDINFSLSDK